MKQKKDSILRYAVLVGVVALVLLAGWLVAHKENENYVHTPINYLLPEEAQVIEMIDTHEFRDGTTFVAAYIPPEVAEAFAQKLQGRNFVETPITEDVKWELSAISEAEATLNVVNGLWHFKDDTPEQFRGEQCYNYTFMIFDVDTGIFYYVESDS